MSDDAPEQVTKATWLQWCRLTCLGGSEHGECPCKGPSECKLQGHPNFQHQRNEATERLWRYAFKEKGDPQ